MIDGNAKHTIEPIYTLKKLSYILGVKEKNLIEISKASDSLYKQNPQEKKGKIMMTYVPQTPLKMIQLRIKNSLLDNVIYPDYLMGGIKGKSAYQNAKIHLNCNILINEDISAYFESCSYNFVYKIWRGFFGFNKEVADCLTKLTTYNGFLPRGTSTSAQLSNLIFWKHEPSLYENFKRKGFIYTRFIDDISVSSKKILSIHEANRITDSIYYMFQRYGLEPNRKKHKISKKSSRQKINNQTINNGNIYPDKALFDKLKSLIYQCGELIKSPENYSQFKNLFNKASGLYQHIKYFYTKGKIDAPKKIKNLKNKLDIL